ncbi:hypothetical protein GCM10010319_47090 [Streptomyces blastmyceticus]|uniref:Uncharacterized protein n=1 Tax=Streptomyces blastmyceticus TaxID=68180 RepID=A0ABP3H973_9ACTN
MISRPSSARDTSVRPANREAGALIALRHDLGESADGPDLSTGSMAYPACRCKVHRAGKGQPDSAVRLGAKGAP